MSLILAATLIGYQWLSCFFRLPTSPSSIPDRIFAVTQGGGKLPILWPSWPL